MFKPWGEITGDTRTEAVRTEQLQGFGWQIRQDGDTGVSPRGVELRTRRLLREALGPADGMMPPASAVLSVVTLAGLALVVIRA